MRKWNLAPDDPLNLVIAADAGLSAVDPLDDHIWEMTVGGGEPRALAIRTRYGGRAVEARYFPVFQRGTEMIVDPHDFIGKPVIKRIFPNYIDLFCSPLEGVEVTLEYWVPGSKVLAGRISIRNLNPSAGLLQVDWAGQLLPLEEGETMIPETLGMNRVLAGRCGNLTPVCFISGGCTSGSSVFPGLGLELQPRKTNTQVFTWASAALEDRERSFHAARNAAFRSWEAEVSRLEAANEARMVEIETGQADWDAALHASQKTAFSLVLASTENPIPSRFFTRRDPGDGFSPPGRPAGFNMDTVGGNAWDSLHISESLLPGGAETARGFLLNLLGTQIADGSLDWSAGMGGTGRRVNAQPVLSQFALRLEPYFADHEWLREALPKLAGFYRSWFLPQNDRDGDGFPEWRSRGQSGLPGEGFAWIESLESPGLAALLLGEGEALRQIASILGEPLPEQIILLQDRLSAALQECWDDHEGIFRFRDRDFHQTSAGETLLEVKMDGRHEIRRKFDRAQRLHLRIETDQVMASSLSVTLQGRGAGKPIQFTLKGRDFSWKPGFGEHTVGVLFSQIDRVVVRGLGGECCLRVGVCDSGQLAASLLLPLATSAATEAQVKILTRVTIPLRFLFPGGILAAAGSRQPSPVSFCAYLAGGLLSKGERGLAVQIITRLLDDLAVRLSDRQTPASNSLENTAPAGLFLRLCGVEAITPREVIFNGFNPLEKEVRVKFRNLSLILQADKSVILIDQNEPITITDPGRVRIPLGKPGKRS